MNRLPNARVLTRPLLLLALGLASAPLGGCFIGALVGGMAETYQATASHEVEAEFTGLEGKNYAIIVSADRSIEASFPALVPAVTERVFQNLYSSNVGKGCVAPAQSLAFLYNNPRWLVRPRAELAKELGVDCIVNIEIQEFRLYDPGNQYLWNGVAMGYLSVIDATSPTPELFAFEKQVMVKFPDKTGMGPTDFNLNQVESVLLKRFIDRSSWPFYAHEEKIRPDY